jgi:hypothetical protein
MPATSAVDLLVVAFATLVAAEQDEALVRMNDVRLTHLAEAEGEAARFLRALRRVAELNGGELTPDVYKRTQSALMREDEELPNLSAVIRHYETWSQAKEAVALSETTTAQLIDARFRARLRGQRPHYQTAELRESLARCVAELGRVPLVAEYEAWRTKQLALAQTRGELARVPGVESFRRRHGGWEKALVACGYSTEEIYVRLEAPDRRPRLAKVWRYSDETLGEVLRECARDLGHPPLVEEFQAWRLARLKRTRARAVGLPTDSPYRRRFGTWEGALRRFGFSDEEIAGRLTGGRARSTASMATRRRRENRSALAAPALMSLRRDRRAKPGSARARDDRGRGS